MLITSGLIASALAFVVWCSSWLHRSGDLGTVSEAWLSRYRGHESSADRWEV